MPKLRKGRKMGAKRCGKKEKENFRSMEDQRFAVLFRCPWQRFCAETKTRCNVGTFVYLHKIIIIKHLYYSHPREKELARA
jgi:hypothetical protein